MFTHLRFSKDASIATIVLDRPEKLNAFNFELAHDFSRAIDIAKNDAEIRCVIVRGSGKAFSAGGDLKLICDGLPRADLAFEEISRFLHQAVLSIRQMPKPVLGAVIGPAFAAGFGLTLACDIVVAAESANFSASFIKLGLTPNASVSLYLPRILGWRRAADCLMTGRVLSAKEALDWGLVSRVVPDDQFEETINEISKDLANRPTQSLGEIKRLMNLSLGFSLESHLDSEKTTIAKSALSEDFAEGVKAFVEKRSPVFKGR